MEDECFQPYLCGYCNLLDKDPQMEEALNGGQITATTKVGTERAKLSSCEEEMRNKSVKKRFRVIQMMTTGYVLALLNLCM